MTIRLSAMFEEHMRRILYNWKSARRRNETNNGAAKGKRKNTPRLTNGAGKKRNHNRYVFQFSLTFKIPSKNSIKLLGTSRVRPPSSGEDEEEEEEEEEEEDEVSNVNNGKNKNDRQLTPKVTRNSHNADGPGK